MFSLDLLADLPEPRDDEPSSFRADIVDELADHLHCAFRREVLKDGDAAAAQRRALDRFGDPKELARRLWWQAMRSRLMRQRILSGLQWMVALTAILISGAVFWQQSQLLAELRQARQEEAAQRQALTAKLDRLQPPESTLGPPIAPFPDQVPAFDPYGSSPVRPGMDSIPEGPIPEGPIPEGPIPEGPIPEGPIADSTQYGPYGPPPFAQDPPVLTLNFVQATQDGPSVAPAAVTLTSSDGVAHQGAPNINFVTVPASIQYPDGRTASSNAVRETTDNKVVFRGLEPDLYQLLVILADGQQSVRPISIRDEKPRELTIICPGPRKKAPVAVSIKPLPEKLQKRNFEVRMEVGAAPVEIGQAKWIIANAPWQRIMFDRESGLPVAVGTMSGAPPYFDLRDLPADERRVFLPVGTISFRFEASEKLPGAGSVPLYQWPKPTGEENGLRHTIGADENTWEIDLPREYLDGMSSDDDAGAFPYGNPSTQ